MRFPNVFNRRPVFALMFLTATLHAGDSSANDFADARKGFKTKLTKELKEDFPAEFPPPMMFDLVKYKSPAGELSAYVGTDPGDGKKHPAIIWLVGGFGSSISEIAWETMERENDQTASQFRKAGIVTLYPSLRGGNDNPGQKEGFLGEVDDVLAAAAYLKSLDYVDPDRIYLGGHSTGGTLALLTAAAAPEGLFNSVFSLGPVARMTDYPSEYLPFDESDQKESNLRAPIEWLDSISSPTFVFEGEDGNVGSLLELQKAARGKDKLTFFPVKNQTHFSVIAPLLELFSAKILADEPIKITRNDVQTYVSAQQPPPRPSFPAGDPQQDRVSFEFAIYLIEKADGDEVISTLKSVAEKEFPELKWSESDEPSEGLEFMAFFVEDVFEEGYGPPTVETLKYKGVGISKEAAEELQSAKHALRVWFRHPGDQSLKGLKTANQLIGAVSAKLKGLPWDEQTRQVFSEEAWQVRRIDSWKEKYPDMRFQITLHAYRNGGHIRAITLGMEKFGLPEVQTDQMSWSENRGISNLMNCLCQLLVEDMTIENPDHFAFDVNTIKNEVVRTDQLESILENGKGKSIVALKKGAWDLGDAENISVEIYPDQHDGPDFFARQNALVSEIFGFEDQVSMVKHNDEDLQAASDRAKKLMPKLQKDFAAGLEPGEHILVKAPFETDDGGNEWMWVDVQKWAESGEIEGMLRSEPRNISDLSAGQKVTVFQKDLFDYIRRKPDGTDEGNETGKIIQQMLQQK